MITIQFLGGAGTVTGSKFAVHVNGRMTLVDCGLAASSPWRTGAWGQHWGHHATALRRGDAVQGLGSASITCGIGVAPCVGMHATASDPIVEDVHGKDDFLSIELIRRRLSTRYVGFELHLFNEVPSTNDVACRLAEKGAREGAVVLAETQSAGRGRFGHSWFSPGNANLYASVIFRPAIAPSAVPVFSLIASLALADAVTGEGAPASVRWPHDVIVSGRRVGGTLTVVAAAGAVIQHVIFGIGVNLNISSEALAGALGPSAAMATSVSEVAGRPIDRNRFAASLLNRLERWHGLYTGYGPDAVRAAWNQRDALRGRLVEVHGGEASDAGRVLGVDEGGRLILESASGDQRITCGEITTIDGERIR